MLHLWRHRRQAYQAFWLAAAVPAEGCAVRRVVRGQIDDVSACCPQVPC